MDQMVIYQTALEQAYSGRLPKRQDGYLEVPTALFVTKLDLKMPPLPELALYTLENGKPKLLREKSQPYSALALSTLPFVLVKAEDAKILHAYAESRMLAAATGTATGEPIPMEKRMESLRKAAVMVVEDLFNNPSPENILFAATLALLFAIARLAPRIPGAVVAAIMGIAIGYLAEAHMLPFAIQTLFSKYGAFKATVIQLPAFQMPPASFAFAKAVFTVAIVAILETLLSAKIVDGMTNTRFHQKKEMLGLALANIGSGLAGGLPATGVLARTALNAKSGATSRYSSGINALFVLLIALVLFPGFQYLPMAVVAAILVFAAIRMIEVEHFKRLFHFDQSSFWLAMLVAALTFAVDPMMGIFTGATISLLEFAQHLSRGQSELTLHKNQKLLARIPHHRLPEFDGQSDVIVYRFAGELTYFNAKSHEDAFRKIQADTLILSLRNLFYIDLDGLDILHEIIGHQEKAGKKVILTGASEFITPLLEKSAWFRAKEQAGAVFGSTTEALRSLGFPLGA
jgi:MFS superfamily sulfate permease-like transporter